jgi:chromosome segregation ATPase
MHEDNEIYNSIVREFNLNDSVLEKIKEKVETLARARMDICKCLKILKFKFETLEENQKELTKKIHINKSNIKDYEKKQIQLRDKIKINKQEIKVIKLHVNKLEEKLMDEQEEGRRLREALHVFLSKEKFKFVKNLFIKKYRKVFFKYSNDLSIRTKIEGCNKRKKEIREEIEALNNSIDKYNRKTIIDKIALAKIRKSIIGMQKQIDFFAMRIQMLEKYQEMERNFILEIQQY